MGSLLGDWPSYDPHNFSQLRPSDPSKMSPATYHPTHNRTLPPPDQVITTEAKNILLRNFYERAEEKLRQKRAASEHLMPEHGCKQARPLRHIKLAVPIQKRTRLSISPASTTAIQVDGPSASSKASKTLPFRVGHGFDLHRLEPGYPLIIGGIDVPRDRGCEAHSDGDVLLHCVVDAVLGALGLPDIGQIFPDSDPTWKGAPSSVFIKEAVRPTHDAGYEIGNLDATLILQRPKLSPHKEAIRANLSELLGADPSVVNLKAKTHEKVDSLGENRSIAAHTVVLLMKK